MVTKREERAAYVVRAQPGSVRDRDRHRAQPRTKRESATHALVRRAGVQVGEQLESRSHGSSVGFQAWVNQERKLDEFVDR